MASGKPNRAAEPGPLERGIALLRAFVDGQEEWGVRELAAATGEPTSTTHRLLSRLRALGWLEFDEGLKRYRVGFELLRIGAVLAQRNRVSQAALPALETLAETLDESAWLFLHDAARSRVACVAEHAPARALRLPPPLGHEEPLESGPAGWAVLAALAPAQAEALARGLPGAGETDVLRSRLADARADGYCAGSSALLPEAVVVAAPVLDAAGSPRAALCVAVPRVRFHDDDARRIGIAVRDEARRLSYLLGATFLGGASAGSWHDAASAISGLMRRQSPELPITPAQGGGQSNVEDLRRGRAAYCLTTAASLADALRGAGDGDERLAAVVSLSALYLHVFTRPGMRARSLRDLAALRVSPGAEGFSSAHLYRELLAEARLVPGEGRAAKGAVLHLDYPEAMRLLREGKLDALFWLTHPANTLCRELAGPVRAALVALPEAALAQFADGHAGYEVASLAAPGGAIRTLRVPTVIATLASRPDEEVYRLARVVHDNRHELAVQGVVDAGPDGIGPCPAGLPAHPGAARFWRELEASRGKPQPRARSSSASSRS